jgi:predicted O-methyltransferase YrrM
MEIEMLLTEMERFGAENDRRADDYSRRMMNITRDTGQFLQMLVLASRAQRILELGTSNGYSTLWLARAARLTGGRVKTVERLDSKIALARDNFARSGLGDLITQVQDQGGDFLSRLVDDSYDFIFLDSARAEYPRWWPHLKRILSPGGLWVADNALTHPDDFKPLIPLVEADPQFSSCLVPVGNGEYVAIKHPNRT